MNKLSLTIALLVIPFALFAGFISKSTTQDYAKHKKSKAIKMEIQAGDIAALKACDPATVYVQYTNGEIDPAAVKALKQAVKAALPCARLRITVEAVMPAKAGESEKAKAIGRAASVTGVLVAEGVQPDKIKTVYDPKINTAYLNGMGVKASFAFTLEP